MTDYIVYTEIHDGGIERWYYGTYEHERANEVALELGHDREQGIYHCVCKASDAQAMGVQNLPW